MHLNNTARSVDLCAKVPDELVASSTLQSAMLFELSFAVGEQLLSGCSSVDWDAALAIAIRRQRRHFDARLPESLTDVDKEISVLVGENLHLMLGELAATSSIISSPHIPGFQWVSSGSGDFSFNSTLVEVKCTRRRFGASDYRQILMYWLLSYAASIEGRSEEWSIGVLLNPRLNLVVEVPFGKLIATTGAGRTKVELLELFAWMVGDYSGRIIDHV